MSRTFNHRTSKSTWKASCKKQTNRSIRYSKYTELSGCSDEMIFRMEEVVIKNINNLTCDEAQEMFNWIDLHVEEEISIIPMVAKFRFYMD